MISVVSSAMAVVGLVTFGAVYVAFRALVATGQTLSYAVGVAWRFYRHRRG